MSIQDRVLGQYPISVPTSLALESVCGIHPDIPVSSPPILKYDELWINIRTLFRNIYSAIDPNDVVSVNTHAMLETILDEMTTIENIISDNTEGKTKVVFYYSNYDNIESRFHKGVVRRDNTEKQKEYTAFHNNTIKILIDIKKKDKVHHDIRLFDLALKNENKSKALIITHYAIDLLSSKEFSHLTLLESHTGAIREKALWHRKFLNGKELSQIPFNKVFIQVFGDAETFRPMAISLRKEVLEIATKYNWSSLSTRDKLIYSIDQMKNQYSRDILKSMF